MYVSSAVPTPCIPLFFRFWAVFALFVVWDTCFRCFLSFSQQVQNMFVENPKTQIHA